MKSTTQLRQLLNSNQTILAPGAFDGLSARLVEQQGFQLIYASGGAIARSTGRPDIGLLTMTEISQTLATLVEVTTLPIIADADTGYGNVWNVERMVHAFEATGIAAIHMEDQEFPKRCGHLAGKALISTAEMRDKIKVVQRVKSDPDFILIARTDAIAVEGFDKALDRAKAYLDAGADMIFVEAPETIKQIERIAQTITQPKLINMFHGGKTPLVSKQRLHELGYNIIIIPSDLQRAAIQAMQKTLKVIYENGDSQAVADQLTSFKEREQIIDSARYLT